MIENELKPVRCGCGGEVHLCLIQGYEADYEKPLVMVCEKCGTCTANFATKEEAIKAWNTAMSGVVAENAITEQTAKVENIWAYSHFIKFGFCSNCGEAVKQGNKYCHECGLKLDWSE